jgi:3D-(3,5/4)-trihydroxycyclohexane-1,2-dione acylhydrolase (decyclizing)
VRVIRVEPGENVIADLEAAVAKAKAEPEGSGPVLIHVESDPLIDAPDSESWWDVPVASVSELDSTRNAYKTYADHKATQKPFIG